MGRRLPAGRAGPLRLAPRPRLCRLPAGGEGEPRDSTRVSSMRLKAASAVVVLVFLLLDVPWLIHLARR